nr:sesquiterpene synthase [Trametes versicolor]
MPQQYIHIPDLMATWPWPDRIHPLHEEVDAESSAWLKSFAPFTPQSQHAFDKCNAGLLCAHVYPDISRKALRTSMDLINILFVVDEYTDVESAPAVREIADMLVDAVYNPQKPGQAGELVLGKMMREWSRRCLPAATPEAVSHFRKSFTDYLEAVVSEAEGRCTGTIRSIDSYMKNRRENNGVRPSLFPCELHLSIPDEVFYHPHVVDLQTCIVDMITTVNDIISYNREQATHIDDCNLLTVVMRELGTNFDGAMAWIVDYHHDVATRFIEGLKNIPSFGPEADARLQEYLQSIASWPGGADSWSFESARYFGERGAEYQKSRRVPLLQKSKRYPQCRREKVHVHLIEHLAQPTS